MIALKIEKLAVGYGRKKIVDCIDFEVGKGQIVCLLGPNGSGKTTILKTIAGLLSPVTGSVFIEGRNINIFDKTVFSRKVGVVLTEKIMPGLMTVFDVVSLGRYPHTGFLGVLKKEDVDAINEAISLVQAENIAKRYFHELSDGERQKTLIARALAQEPDILVLDEPIGHLDVHHRIEVLTILKKLSKNKHITIIMSLHEVDLAIKISDLVVLLNNGKLAAVGSPEDIIDKNTIKSLYGIKHGDYNHTLGSTEILPHIFMPQIFVLAGSGMGAPIYRMLAKCGFSITTGVLHQNDIDYCIADSIGAETICERPFELIGEEAFLTAKEKMLLSKHIIDSGYPIGRMNRLNGDLTAEALKLGRSVLSMRSHEESMNLFGQSTDRIEYFDSVVQLVSRLNRQL